MCAHDDSHPQQVDWRVTVALQSNRSKLYCKAKAVGEVQRLSLVKASGWSGGGQYRACFWHKGMYTWGVHTVYMMKCKRSVRREGSRGMSKRLYSSVQGCTFST